MTLDFDVVSLNFPRRVFWGKIPPQAITSHFKAGFIELLKIMIS